MNKLWLLYFITFTTILISCKKGDNGSTEIYGTWKLTETWNDPGDGSGKYIKVKGKPRYIVIDTAGKLEGDAMPGMVGYKIQDTERIQILGPEYALTVYQYKLTGNTLELNPPCIEGCGLKFKRM